MVPLLVMPLCGSAALAEHWEDLPAFGGVPSLHGATGLWLCWLQDLLPRYEEW